jgi:hypothetical protein
LAEVLPSAVVLFPGSVDDFTFANGQSKEVGTQNAGHEQQPLGVPFLVDVTGTWDQPRPQRRQVRVAKLDLYDLVLLCSIRRHSP